MLSWMDHTYTYVLLVLGLLMYVCIAEYTVRIYIILKYS